MVTFVVSLEGECPAGAGQRAGVWVVGSAAGGLCRIRKCLDLRFALHLSPESSLLPAGEDLEPALTQGLPGLGVAVLL